MRLLLAAGAIADLRSEASPAAAPKPKPPPTRTAWLASREAPRHHTVLQSPDADLPTFMDFTNTAYIRHDDDHFRCESLTATGNYALDPSYYNHANCFCYPGYTGEPPMCLSLIHI